MKNRILSIKGPESKVPSIIVRREIILCARVLNFLVFAIENFPGFEILAIGPLACEHDICLYAMPGATAIQVASAAAKGVCVTVIIYLASAAFSGLILLLERLLPGKKQPEPWARC